MNELDRIGLELPGIARAAIQHWLERGKDASVPARGSPAPVFVTLRNPDGSLRGCIGSVVASQPDVAHETARSAVLAATRDPRFPPVAPSELAALDVEVSVLAPAETAADLGDLDPRRYGVIVRDDHGRQGLLLPDIEGIGDASVQVSIARRKAGIPEGAPVTLSRFEVKKWRDPGQRRS